jgi:hypothetical protein
MLTNRTPVAIHVKTPVHGQTLLMGTIYQHTPEWVNLDWNCIARGTNGKEYKFNGYSDEHDAYDYQSLYIPTHNIISITELV